MRSKNILLAALGLSTGCLHAQTQINLYGNLVFDQDVSYQYDSYTFYRGTILSAPLWGGGLEYFFNSKYSGEILYLRQDAKADFAYSGGYAYTPTYDNFHLGINYILASGAYHKAVKSSDLYFALMAGMANIHAERDRDGHSGTVNRFAWGGRVGYNLMFNKQLGLKFQALFTSTVRSVGGSAYFGGEPGQDAMNNLVSNYQFALGLGLVYRFPNNNEP